MVKITLDLSNRELEILLFCLDSAIDIVNLSKKEKKRAIELRNELNDYLET
jgi:hypothetical protein